MKSKRNTARLSDVLNADTTLGWLRMLNVGIVTPTMLERYCDWRREEVLNAGRETMLIAWRTDFDFYKAFRNSPICLCMAASIATTSFLKEKVTEAKLEVLSARSQSKDEVIADIDEVEIIDKGVEELNCKLRELADTPDLLPKNGLLRFR